MTKRLALTNDGRITLCSSSEENLGKGRCNHLSHQKSGEIATEFIQRIELKEKYDNSNKIEYTKDHITTLKLLIKEIFPNDDELQKRIDIHDLDKVSMLESGIHPKDASFIHRETQSHHPESETVDLSEIGIKEMILDFESAGFTKPDKPLNAYDTVHKYYSDYIDKFTPVLEKYDMNYHYLVSEKYPDLFNKIQNLINN